MKYVSLIGALKLYGAYVTDVRAFRMLGYELMSRSVDAHRDYHVFTIETGEPDKDGQIMKTLRFSRDLNIYSIMGSNQPPFVSIPPIVELEWLATCMDMSENYKEILEYLAYMFIMQFIGWNGGVNAADPECYAKVLEDKGAVIELENLAMTPAILSAMELPFVKLPKIKSWQMLYGYGQDFVDVFRLCREQSQSTRELYHHMPIMLVLFMVSCKTTKLKGWLKSDRIQLENDLRDTISSFGTHSVAGPVPVTYGGCVSVTGQDMAFMRYVLDAIRKELHDVNNNMGLITVAEYNHVRGPERIRANVRLSSMGIDWNEELRKAEEEKKAREEAAEGEFDEEGE